jgi:raffinose/stachyose/melibiose transport system permease protein
LPLLKEITFICFVLSSTGLLRSFDHIWALTKGGPNHASEVIAIYMYNQAFMLYRSGRAMAVSVIMILIGIVITLAGRRFTRNEDIT